MKFFLSLFQYAPSSKNTMNSSSIDRRRSSPEKKTLDQCKPEDMLDILLTRIKDNLLDDDKKALLKVELEDLRLFFQV